MTVEQVLQFLNSKDTMYKLAEFVDKKLKGMNLPKTMSAYENDDNDELADKVQEYGITFFCAFGDRDYQDDVYVVGYDKGAGEILVKGCAVIGDICPVRIDELEYNSLLDLCRALRG